MKNPYIDACFNPFLGSRPPLVKKLTVMGIMGKTKNVITQESWVLVYEYKTGHYRKHFYK
jgi:hypothetical protein